MWGTETAAIPTRVRAVPDSAVGRPMRAQATSLVVALDVVALTLATVLGIAISRLLRPSLDFSWTTEVVRLLPWTALSVVVGFAAYGLYGRSLQRIRPSMFPDLARFGHALLVAGVVSVLGSGALAGWVGGPRLDAVEAGLVLVPAALLVRIGRSWSLWFSARRGVVRSRVAIVGSGPAMESLGRRLAQISDIDVVGVVDDGGLFELVGALGPVEDLPAICASHSIDRVVVAVGEAGHAIVAQQLRALPAAVQVSMVPPLWESLTWQSEVEDLNGMPVIDLLPARTGWVQRATKRGLDLVIGSFLLLVTLPALLAIAMAVKLTSRGPVLFRQTRIGRGNQGFTMYKFRTMTHQAEDAIVDLRDRNEGHGPLFKLRSDPRVTPVGRWLRKRSFDEIPQLLNVLKGDMSLVGPRPFVPTESAAFTGWSARRFDVRPGMTGQWQVCGRSDLPFEELKHMDYMYVASWSLWWDVKILWHTPSTVLAGQGAY